MAGQIIEPEKKKLFNPFSISNLFRILSKKGLGTGINSYLGYPDIGILGSNSTEVEDITKDFSCCCEGPRSRICFHGEPNATIPDPEDASYSRWFEMHERRLRAPHQPENNTTIYMFGFSEKLGDTTIDDTTTFEYIIDGESVLVPWYQTRNMAGKGCDIVIDYFGVRCRAYPYLDPYNVKEFIESGGFYLSNTEWGNLADNDLSGCGDKINFEDHMITIGSNIRRGCNTISASYEKYNNSTSPLLTNVMVQGAATAEIVGGTSVFTTTNKYLEDYEKEELIGAPGCPGGNVNGMGDRIGNGALLLFGDSNMYFGGTRAATYSETFDQYYKRITGADLPLSLEFLRGEYISTFRRNLILTSIEDVFTE